MSTNVNNFHWTEADITNYTKDFIKSKLKDLGYEIKKFNCEASITQRRGKIGFVYCFDMDLYNIKTENSIIISGHDQFSDFSSICDEEDRNNLENIIQSWKNDAELSKRESVQNYESKNKEEKGIPKILREEKIHNKDNDINYVNFELKINCSKSEIDKFLFEDNFISIWTGNSCEKNDKSIIYMDRLILFDIIKKDDDYSFKMKLKEWENMSDTKLIAEDRDYGVLLKIRQQNPKVSDSKSLKEMWLRLVFYPICLSFSKTIIS